jgi:hypothetical protein
MEVRVSEATARIVGERHELALTIEASLEARFRLAVLEKESKANAEPVALKRLSVEAVANGGTLTYGEAVVRIRGRVTMRDP